jgi:DNA-binding MarR family transcriptional regulator
MVDDVTERRAGGLQRFGLARDRLNIGLCRTVGLSQSDFHALEHLEASGRLTPTQLAERLGLTSGAVTTLIDRLEQAGWVVRAPNPRDRRSLVVEFSRSAKARGRSIVGAYERDVEEAIRGLSKRDLAIVNRVLETVAEIADAHADELWQALRDRS